jgi:hypothetical protein
MDFENPARDASPEAGPVGRANHRGCDSGRAAVPDLRQDVHADGSGIEALSAELREAAPGNQATALSELAAQFRAEHAQAVFAFRSGVEHAKRGGELLIRAKDLLPHGAFIPWLQKNCGVSRRTAANYMKVARGWTTVAANGKPDAHLNLRDALKLLTKPRDPDRSDEFPVVDMDLPTDYRCPCCLFEWSGKPKPEVK